MPNRYYQGPPSDHFDGTRFFNPGHPSTDKSLADLLRWRFGERHAPWLPSGSPPQPTARPAPRQDRLTVTMIGHASLLSQAAGLNLLVDPVWSPRASPVRFAGPKRHDPPGIAFADLPPIDAVLLTHSHYDHMDAATLARLRDAHHPLVVTALGNDTILAQAVPGLRTIALDWGQHTCLGPMQVTAHPAYHWSARRLRDRRMALWCGFVLQSPAGTAYLAGDTGYGDGAPFHLVRRRFGPPDLAIFPIGAYAPRWFMRAQHMDPDDAVQAMRDCGAHQALGIHWGTFRLTDEPRFEPRDRLAAACARQGIDPACFLPLRPGDRWSQSRP